MILTQVNTNSNQLSDGRIEFTESRKKPMQIEGYCGAE